MSNYTFAIAINEKPAYTTAETVHWNIAIQAAEEAIAEERKDIISYDRINKLMADAYLNFRTAVVHYNTESQINQKWSEFIEAVQNGRAIKANS